MAAQKKCGQTKKPLDNNQALGFSGRIETNIMNTAEKITFRRREYVVTKTLPVTPLLAKEGLVQQAIITGKNGANRLLQVWADGVMRTISASGKVEEQIA